MFSIDPSLQRLQASRDQIVTLVESVNQPHVAVPGKPAQNAQAFVIGTREPSGDFALHVWLWLVQTREAVVYVPEARPIPLADYRAAELEALQFCESMGFMTEPVSFRGLAPEAQDELLERLPPFQDPARLAAEASHPAAPLAVRAAEEASPAEAGSDVTPEEADRLARLLASF